MKIQKFAGALLALSMTAGTAHAVPMYSFLIDGNTFTQPFSFSNTSDAGENLVAFGINLAGTGLVFDPLDGGPPGNGTLGVPFTPVGAAAATTGQLTDFVVDGGLTLDVTFNDFNPGETFAFDLDVDFLVGSPTVNGDDMIGATAFADFSDGQRVIGTFLAVPGNSDASAFNAQGIIPIPDPDPVPAIPVPAALPLLGTGLAIMGLFGWRRKRKGADV